LFFFFFFFSRGGCPVATLASGAKGAVVSGGSVLSPVGVARAAIFASRSSAVRVARPGA
jgi:hypothetical protein